jgi:hypothetical protein
MPKSNIGLISSSSGDKRDTTYNKIDDIKKIINLSRVTLDTNNQIKIGIYKIGSKNESVPGPSDYYLIGSFKVLHLDTTKLESINLLKTPLEINSFEYKEWLPNSIKEGLFNKEKFTEQYLYSSNLFARSPFLTGFFILQKDSTVYLQMLTQ